MCEGQFCGVQEHAGRERFVAVEGVADDGCAESAAFGGDWGGTVDAELVGAAGDGDESQACAREGRVVVAREDGEVGDGWLAVDPVDDLARAVVDVGADGERHFAGVASDVACDDCDVGLFSQSLFELFGEGSLRVGGESDDQQAACVHVEAMDDERTCRVRERARDAGGDAILIGFAFAGHAEQARGFVDDREMLVGEDDVERGRHAGSVHRARRYLVTGL